MKIVENHDLISIGPFPSSDEWRMVCDHVRDAVIATDWPHGSGKFTIYPQSGKKRGEGNGVDPIKTPCLQKLQALGWKTENLTRITLGTLGQRDLDAVFKAPSGIIGMKWQISTESHNHRAIDKALRALKSGELSGAILVVPGRNLVDYLAASICSVEELKPYFTLWRSLLIEAGALRLIVVEHDTSSFEVSIIPKRRRAKHFVMNGILPTAYERGASPR